MEDLRSVGASSCNSGDGTDQRVQSLMLMMMMRRLKLILLVVLSKAWICGRAAARLLGLRVRIPPGHG